MIVPTVVSGGCTGGSDCHMTSKRKPLNCNMGTAVGP
jgi:hypothetical protein